METMIRLLFAASLVVNGALGGLIAGRLLSEPAGCKCGDDCDCRRRLLDDGPFPTGWVSPDPGPAPTPTPPPRPGGRK